MTRDTRLQQQPVRPSAAVQRAWQEIAALLSTPPANCSADELLAMRERCRLEAEAAYARQGCLPFGSP